MPNDRDRRRFSSASGFVLREIEGRLEAGARRYLDKYNCLLSRAGIDVDELVQVARIAADRAIQSHLHTWPDISDAALDELINIAISRGILRMRTHIQSFFRHSDVYRRYKSDLLAREMGIDEITPERSLVYRDGLEAFSQDDDSNSLVRVIVAGSGAETKESIARSLNISSRSLGRLQTKMRKRFYDP